MQFTLTPHTPRGALARAKSLAGARRPGGTLALAGLIVAGAFALGGSARPDVASLEILRPLAAAALGVAIFNVRRAHFRSYRVPLAIAIAFTTVTVVGTDKALPSDARTVKVLAPVSFKAGV